MSTRPQPPIAARKPVQHRAHGETREDPYHWLKTQGREDPEVLAYLEAENAHLDASLAPLEALRQDLYAELLSHLQETDQDPPVPWGEWAYYQRTEAGQQYPLHCRRPLAGGPEQVLLDPNALKAEEGLEQLWVGLTRPSPDHTRLAYLLDTKGAERFEIRVRDLAGGGETRTGVTEVSGGSLEWSADGSRLYYIRTDAAWRPHQLYRHTLGADPATDERLVQEDDETFRLHLTTSDSGAELLLTSDSTLTSEVQHLAAGDVSGSFAPIWPRERGVEYEAEDGGDHWLITTNRNGAREFVLLALPKAGGEPRTVLAHDPARKLDGVKVFERFLIVMGREEGLAQLWVLPRDGNHYGEPRRVPAPEAVYTWRLGPNHQFAAGVARVVYSSSVTPTQHLDLDLETLQTMLVKATPVPGYDPGLYAAERLWVTARDVALVPVTLVFRRDAARPAPTYLYGYGSYGISLDPAFNASRLPLLDRGWVCATAHVRGGGELGRAWYEGGKLEQKAHTFHDFVDCAEALLSEGVAQPGAIVAEGRSAGGLLMGAVLNERPDLFAAAIAGVPFVDVLSTMEDASIPLTTLEYDEWGNPADAGLYAAMRAYSPYDNIGGGRYPHLWVSTGLNDPRVAYWEPAKWVARLRAEADVRRTLVLKTLLGVGHFSASGRYDALCDRAAELAFLIGAVEGRLDAEA